STQIYISTQRQIGLFTGEMKLVDMDRLIDQGKLQRAVIVHLYVFYVGGKLGDIGRDRKCVRVLHGPAHLDVAVHGRMAGNGKWRISANQGIEIQVLKL